MLSDQFLVDRHPVYYIKCISDTNGTKVVIIRCHPFYILELLISSYTVNSLWLKTFHKPTLIKKLKLAFDMI